ncbi:scavenger receptor cysteine-rich type 1 protein M130-like, partial [Cetorhinus maximus]
PVPLRLVDGSSVCAGRLEVLSRGSWSSVCQASWTQREARVVCRALNCGSPISTAWPSSHSRNTTGGSGLLNVTCEGNETTLSLCSTGPGAPTSCPQTVGVTCSGPVPVRLVNGNGVCSGRVEVHRRGVWESVCDGGWGAREAGVVCRMLNCGRAVSATGGAYYGEGGGLFRRAGVRCSGSESALDQCSAKPPGEINCTRGQEAGVTCSGPVPVRLADGETTCSGRVEVHRDGVWGAVCSSGWDGQASDLVCRMIGCGESRESSGGSVFGQGSGTVGLANVTCRGSETLLDHCPASPWGPIDCPHAGVTCTGE